MKRWFAFFSAVLMSLTLIQGTCWGNTAWVTVAEEDAANVFYSTVTYDGQNMGQWEYRLASFKTVQDKEAVPFLFPSDKITAAEIETFLTQKEHLCKTIS